MPALKQFLLFRAKQRIPVWFVKGQKDVSFAQTFVDIQPASSPVRWTQNWDLPAVFLHPNGHLNPRTDWYADAETVGSENLQIPPHCVFNNPDVCKANAS